jgi:sugar-specific transcriptional regulator TrmB
VKQIANFQEFGLSYYESKALDVLLREHVTPKQLSRRAGVPPGKVYSVIAGLRRRGIIDETESRPKQLYIPDPSAAIARLISQRQHQDEALYAELRRLASEAAAVRSQPSRFFQLGTTIEENKEIQLRTFTEAQREVCQIINIHHKPRSNRQSKTAWEKEIDAAIHRGVSFRAIYPKATALPQLLQKLPKEQFCVRRLDTDFIRCDIIDGKKVLLKLVHEDPLAFGGIVFIEDERFARNLQRIFEQFWEQAR